MISEGSCDTEDWMNDAENSALRHRNKWYFRVYVNRKPVHKHIPAVLCTFLWLPLDVVIRTFYQRRQGAGMTPWFSHHLDVLVTVVLATDINTITHAHNILVLTKKDCWVQCSLSYGIFTKPIKLESMLDLNAGLSLIFQGDLPDSFIMTLQLYNNILRIILPSIPLCTSNECLT